ncbi:protein of unknown function [Lactiplantibacillus plantarum]
MLYQRFTQVHTLHGYLSLQKGKKWNKASKRIKMNHVKTILNFKELHLR